MYKRAIICTSESLQVHPIFIIATYNYLVIEIIWRIICLCPAYPFNNSYINKTDVIIKREHSCRMEGPSKITTFSIREHRISMGNNIILEYSLAWINMCINEKLISSCWCRKFQYRPPTTWAPLHLCTAKGGTVLLFK